MAIKDLYTFETEKVLEERFRISVNGIYFAHQPIYGFRTPYADTSNIARYMVTQSILSSLSGHSFTNFIDIGGAEGYTANLVKTIFKVPVKSTDLSENACKMAKAIFGIDAVPCDIHNLPFNDSAFDAVLCSETIEHVTDYKKAVHELLRITKKILVITVPHETPEIVAKNIENKVPHGHIHYFDIHSLDYLKELGYKVNYQKTLSPLLIIPRVIVEGFKKKKEGFLYKIYNSTSHIFKMIFGIRSANFLVDLDTKFTKLFGLYGGITFTLSKQNEFQDIISKDIVKIKAASFTGITVDPYRL